jgi:hypothetical protein
MSQAGYSSLTKLKLSEKILLDASEFINAVYEDMSQINEILTLKDQTLLIEGVALFYKGYPISNSLNPTYLNPAIALANYHDLFEKTSLQEESIIDTFYVDGNAGGADIDCDLSEEADDEYMHKVLEKETYVKLDEPPVELISEEKKVEEVKQ